MFLCVPFKASRYFTTYICMCGGLVARRQPAGGGRGSSLAPSRDSRLLN